MATDTLASPATLSYGKTKVFKNFIDGEWVESSTGETFENRNPADTRDLVGIFQKSAKADVDAAVAAAKRAFTKWRLVPGAAAGGDCFPRGRDSDRAQGRLCPRDDSRNGQGSGRDARRRAGSDRRRLLQRRRGPPAVRADRAVGDAEQVCHGGAAADRGVRHDYAVEFPHGDFFVEAAAGDCVRQHLRHQAGAGHSALDFQSGARAHGRGAAQGRDQHRRRIRPGGGRSAGRTCRRSRGFVYRIVEGGPHHRRHCGAEFQTLLAGTGRQKSHDRARRREPRSRHGRRTLGRVRHDRPALHRDQPHHRAERRVSRIRRAVGRTREETEGRQRAG